ncbi:Glycerophosphoryl diester phosphodiesterase [Hordeum vulgare]|nr:Glycerophosphoryl diester phosphodiesterase [Hordeum vulgare]
MVNQGETLEDEDSAPKLPSNGTQNPSAANAVALPSASLEEQGIPPQGAVQQVEDPQEEELQVGTPARVPLNDVPQHPNTQTRPWVSPVGPANAVPGHTSVIVLMLIFLGGSDANPATRHHGQLDVNHKKQPLQTYRPYNIAHMGSNGEIPEETAVAYLRAIKEGADFIETDILASKDGHLICSHDVILDTTTDIANRTEFTGRKRTYDVQGVKLTGWFIGKYNILTFDEFILIALSC